MPRRCGRPPSAQDSARGSWTPTGKSDSVSCGVMILSLGSWCMQNFVCALQESVFPVLWKLYNQIPLAFKVKFPGGYPSLCQIMRLGNLLSALELLQQCKNFFDKIVLQFVCHLLGDSMMVIMVTSSRKIYATHNAS